MGQVRGKLGMASRVRADLGASLLALYAPQLNSRYSTVDPDLSGRLRTQMTRVNTVTLDGTGDGLLAYRSNGVDSYVEFEDNLFDGLAEGAVAVAFKALPSGHCRIISDGNQVAGGIAIILSVGGTLIVTTDLGGGSEETISYAELPRSFYGDWLTAGIDWSDQQGKSLFINGTEVASDSGLTGPTGTGTNAPAVGRAGLNYYDVRFRGMAFCDRPIGAGHHRMLHEQFYGRNS